MTDTATSSKRAEANRHNAQKSTGPKTREGKERSRFNALKHGMRAKSEVLPGEDPAAFAARLERWTADIGPRDDVERFLVRRAVQLSWQLERADRALGDRPDVADRADEVVALGRRLFWDPRGPLCSYPQFAPAYGAISRVSWSGEIDDPDDPARLVNRLESNALGCAWLLDRWAELREVLESGKNWQPPERFKAIRLLGRQPLDPLDDRRVMDIYLGCAAMAPGEAHDFADVANELRPIETSRFVERLAERVPREKPSGPKEGRARLLAIIAAEESRLEGILATHVGRGEPADGPSGFDASDAAERLRRHQASCDRALLRVLEALRQRRKDGGEAGVEGRPSRPARPDPPDPSRRVATLLDLVAAARGDDAARPPAPTTPPPADPVVRPSPGSRPVVETIEAIRPGTIARRAGASAVLVVVALLAFAGLAAACATPAAPDPASTPRSGVGMTGPRHDAALILQDAQCHEPSDTSIPAQSGKSDRIIPGRPAPVRPHAFP